MCADADTLATAVAEALIARIAELQTPDRIPSVVLTGGSIARRIHTEVARLSGAGHEPAVDWRRVRLWWGDERFVARDHDERNAAQTYADLLDHVDIDPDHVHTVGATGEVRDVEAAAEAYAATLAAHGPETFDLVMLGLGPDGHCASLFPGHAALTETDATTVSVTDSPKPPPERVSLTFPRLNAADAVWFLVSGEEKADACARARRDQVGLAGLGSDQVRQTPAAGVLGRSETVWWLDEAAAGHR
ncbi:6-phosphogluconolactonase [Nocardioidaceae bacterium]|nr:6-phosphogluconolactonase [Nocardioidaceae bacterium]